MSGLEPRQNARRHKKPGLLTDVQFNAAAQAVSQGIEVEQAILAALGGTFPANKTITDGLKAAVSREANKLSRSTATPTSQPAATASIGNSGFTTTIPFEQPDMRVSFAAAPAARQATPPHLHQRWLLLPPRLRLHLRQRRLHPPLHQRPKNPTWRLCTCTAQHW
ncbi:MAG: hypothetical protein WAX89_07790 [Alphaproteobacteria bacterium]